MFHLKFDIKLNELGLKLGLTPFRIIKDHDIII